MTSGRQSINETVDDETICQRTGNDDKRVPYAFDHLCGGIAGGLVSTLSTHPLDLLMVQFAVNEGYKQAAAYNERPHYKGYVDATRYIVREGGFRALYRGLTPNILGHLVGWGLYMQSYEHLKKSVTVAKQWRNARNMIASAAAGALTCTATNFLWVARTQQFLHYVDDDRPTPTMYAIVARIYREEGIRGLYRGYVPGLLSAVQGAVQIVIYDALKRQYNAYRNHHDDSKAKMPTTVYLTCSAIAKIITVCLKYPYQVVRSRLQDQHTYYGGVLNVVRRTWAHEGVRGFYKGMGASILCVMPATMCTFVVYEHVCHAVRNRF